MPIMPYSEPQSMFDVVVNLISVMNQKDKELMRVRAKTILASPLENENENEQDAAVAILAALKVSEERLPLAA